MNDVPPPPPFHKRVHAVKRSDPRDWLELEFEGAWTWSRVFYLLKAWLIVSADLVRREELPAEGMLDVTHVGDGSRFAIGRGVLRGWYGSFYGKQSTTPEE